MRPRTVQVLIVTGGVVLLGFAAASVLTGGEVDVQEILQTAVAALGGGAILQGLKSSPSTPNPVPGALVATDPVTPLPRPVTTGEPSGELMDEEPPA